MYFCGYFALSNGPNWEVICIIPIFGVILVKIWVFDPLGDPILDYMGQITKITPEMDYLTPQIAKNELLHETLCRLIENFEIFINPRWPPHDFDLFDLENGSRSNFIYFSGSL